MKTKIILEWTLLLFLFASGIFACKKKEEQNDTGTTTGTGKGYASGKVTTSDGKALKGAEIVIGNTVSYNTTLSAITDDKGEYRIKLISGPGIGDWIATGTYTITYNNIKYQLALEADAYKIFSSSNGGVTNFTLKHTGREPSTSPGVKGSFYGGVLSCYPGDDADMSKVTITAKPVQPIIDGSAGQIISVIPELDGNLSWVVNLPIGRYEITAKEGNTPLYIKDYTTPAPASSVLSLTTDFAPCKVNGARYWIKFDVLRNP
jgi:hypothetical protein